MHWKERKSERNFFLIEESYLLASYLESEFFFDCLLLCFILLGDFFLDANSAVGTVFSDFLSDALEYGGVLEGLDTGAFAVGYLDTYDGPLNGTFTG